MIRILLPIAVGSTWFGAMSCMAQSLKPDEVYSSIAVGPISTPNPVLGADGRVHLAYELLVTNPSRLGVTLDKVEAVGAAGKVVGSLESDQLKALTMRFDNGSGPLLPGNLEIIFLDVSLASGQPVPGAISSRLSATRQQPGPDGKLQPLPANSPLPATIAFTGATTAIGKPAVVIEPPLRGERWVVVNGCCDVITSHRGAVMSVNGQIRVPERFAIDFLQLDASNRVFTGDGRKLADYPYYGVPVHAVAPGVVVNLYDDAAEQIPNEPATGITTENIGGNMLVIDIGDGNYAFYAHMQRDSLKVKLGDHVKAGQVIGLLGNTGNTTAPHLHFHIMDGPSPLNANGLPYVFTRFTSRGVAELDGPDDPVEKGSPAKINTSRLTGIHRDELPLNNEVVDFD